MIETLFKWLRKYYNIFIHSIGFFPAVLGLLFLAFAMGALELDSAGVGQKLNERFKWLRLNDWETARTIVSTVATGIISLTVFSFSMVMILMNQAASQMSNRMLDNIIGDRVQKLILSFYVGTIVFSLFLLVNINAGQEEASVPSVSVYLLVVLTVADIFLFIYFLNYITQSFRYEQLIKRIHQRTNGTLERKGRNHKSTHATLGEIRGHEILSPQSGYYQGFDEKRLLKFAEEYNIVIKFLHPPGTYILQGTPFLNIDGNVEERHLQKMFLDIDFYYGQQIDKNAYYGFFHLTEVAVKALSPGVNDPGTATLSIHALTDLFSRLIKQPMCAELQDSLGYTRIVTSEFPLDALFDDVVGPIWHYGKNDRIVKKALIQMLNQLIFIEKQACYESLFVDRLRDVEAGKSFD